VGLNIDNINFQNLSCLKKLDLSNSSGDDKLISKLLKQCSSLKNLSLSYSLKISDEAFTNDFINCNLEDLNLNYTKVNLITLTLTLTNNLFYIIFSRLLI
jgi:hypothetical protein